MTTTIQFGRQEVVTTIDNKKRRRQSQSQSQSQSHPHPHSRKQVVGGNDVVVSIVPSLFILLLLSGSHLPKFDAFQFRSIHYHHWSNKPSMTQPMGNIPATTNDAFLRLRRRTRQNNHHQYQNQYPYHNHYRSDCNSMLSLHSQSINSRSESENSNSNSNSTERIGTETPTSSNEDLPLSSSTSSSSSSVLEAANEAPPSSPGAAVSTNVAAATALRAQAEELRAEARAMELDLRQRATNKRREKDEITDEMIATVFLPLQYQEPTTSSSSDQSTATATATTARLKATSTATATSKATSTSTSTSVATASASASASSTTTIPDARVVADRLRQGKFSRLQIISVVDRLYEQHHDIAAPPATSTNSSEPQRLGEKEELHRTQEQQEASDGETTSRSDNGQYSAYFQVLVQAAILLDDSIVSNTRFEDATKTTAKSTTIQTTTISPEPTSSASPPSVPASSSSSSSSLSSFNFSSTSSSSSSVPSPMPFVTSGHIGKAIQSRIGELRQLKQAELNRKIAAETNRIATMSSSSSSGWSPQYSGSSNNGNSTGDLSGDTPSFIPLWIPSAYIPYILSLDKSTRTPLSTSSSASKSAIPNAAITPVVPFAVIRNSTLEATELEILKNKVLLGSRFYMTSFEFAPGAALFRGNIRTSLGNVPTVVPSTDTSKNKNNSTTRIKNNNTAMVFDDIQHRLEASGLGDKVQLFVLPDPEAGLLTESSSRRPTTTMAMGMRRPSIDAAALPPEDEKPVILALPKKLTPDESKLQKGWIRKIGKRLSYPVAALSTFFYSVKIFALNPIFFDALVNKRDARVLYSCIPLALGFLSVQLIHEAAHYLVAKRKKIKIGFPVPVSTMFYSNLPFFGCITPLRSFPPNRAALVDFALSGPMTSLAVSLCMVFGGALLTSSASAVQIARFPFLSVHTMKSNFLLGSILSWLLPKTMMLPLAQPIPMHPLFVIGRFGMISSALNLLPIFRLDGGRACFAAMGQRQGAVISAFTILWIISNFFMSSSMLLVWTLMVALFQMRVEIPCRDECTEVGGKREWLWLISFLLSVSILIPFPHHGSFL